MPLRGGLVKQHILKRKRLHDRKKKYAPYPHPNPWIGFYDKLMYVVGFTGPIFTLPQVLKIWEEKNASGLSFETWVSYLILAIFWLLYGIIHKYKPIIFNNVIWLILNSIIVFQIIIYG